MAENNTSLKLEQYVQDYAKDPEFIAEGLAIKIVEELLKLLKEKGLSQSWLAEKMEVSRAHISKILNAPPNMTLLTIAKIAVALETKPDVCLNADFKGSSIILPSKSVDFAWLSNDKVIIGEIKASNQFVGTNNGMSDNSITILGSTSVAISGVLVTNINTEILPESAPIPSKTQMFSEEPELVLAA